MNPGRETKENRMSAVNFRINKKEAHITVKKELCSGGECWHKPCLKVCPAGNYTWDEGGNKLIFNYEGCLECGTCRLICPLDAVDWSYPKGGSGVVYLWG